MKRISLLLVLTFLLFSCKTLLNNTDFQVREPTPEDIELAEATQAIGIPGLIYVVESDGSPSGWVKKLTVSDASLTISGSDATLGYTVGAGGGSVTTIREQTVQTGGADIVTLDFGVGFIALEGANTWVDIDFDVVPDT